MFDGYGGQDDVVCEAQSDPCGATHPEAPRQIAGDEGEKSQEPHRKQKIEWNEVGRQRNEGIWLGNLHRPARHPKTEGPSPAEQQLRRQPMGQLVSKDIQGTQRHPEKHRHACPKPP